MKDCDKIEETEKKYQIIVTVDTNDGDYISDVDVISKEDLNKIKPLIEKIKEFNPKKYKRWQHNYPAYWGRSDNTELTPQELYNFSDDVFEIFNNILPSPEEGFHTIESIEITPYVKPIKLL